LIYGPSGVEWRLRIKDSILFTLWYLDYPFSSHPLLSLKHLYMTTKLILRLIPDGAITAAHFIKTPYYVQIHGFWDGTSMNIVRLFATTMCPY
jgi:hypothetical protein